MVDHQRRARGHIEAGEIHIAVPQAQGEGVQRAAGRRDGGLRHGVGGAGHAQGLAAGGPGGERKRSGGFILPKGTFRRFKHKSEFLFRVFRFLDRGALLAGNIQPPLRLVADLQKAVPRPGVGRFHRQLAGYGIGGFQHLERDRHPDGFPARALSPLAVQPGIFAVFCFLRDLLGSADAVDAAVRVPQRVPAEPGVPGRF